MCLPNNDKGIPEFQRQSMVHISRNSTYCIHSAWYKQISCLIGFYDSGLVQFAPGRMFMKKASQEGYFNVPSSEEVPRIQQLCQTENQDNFCWVIHRFQKGSQHCVVSAGQTGSLPIFKESLWKEDIIHTPAL